MRLDLEKIKKQFMYKEDEEKEFKITHNKPDRACFFPYSLKSNEKSFNMKDGLGTLGRLIIDKKINKVESQLESENYVIDEILKKINGIPQNKKDYLKRFFKDLFFTENKLELVHPKLLFFLNTQEQKSEIPLFIRDVFINEKLKDKFLELYSNQKQEMDILTKMLIDTLNQLETFEKKNVYYNKVEYIVEIFQKDLLFLLSKDQLFIDEFENLLTYYYFIYVCLLSLEMNHQLKNDKEYLKGFYFIFNWEKASKQRRNTQEGWRKLEAITENIFSHRALLEMLNYSTDYIDTPKMYKDIYNSVFNLSCEEKYCYNNDLISLRKWYSSSIEAFLRQPIEEEITINSIDDEILKNINLLFDQIVWQFKKSKDSRKGANEKFTKNIIDYGKLYFSKSGGSLGNILSLNENFILLLTKLAINNNKEILLNELYKEFEVRGIFLDKYSKEELLKYYEKLNILNKKSDSGDAIYVKSIL